MSSYRQALKAARTEYIRKLIDNHQNNPRFLFSTVDGLTHKQMSPDQNIPSQFKSNEFMNFFTDKIDNSIIHIAPIKLKKVREKHAAPWYNSYTHSLKKETRILERKWRKITWKSLELRGKTVCPAIDRL